MKTLIVILMYCAFILGGCATGLGMSGMSPEQIGEMAKLKDSSVQCIRGMYAGVSVTAVFLNVDKGIPAGMTISEDCKITFDAKPVPPAK